MKPWIIGNDVEVLKRSPKHMAHIRGYYAQGHSLESGATLCGRPYVASGTWSTLREWGERPDACHRCLSKVMDGRPYLTTTVVPVGGNPAVHYVGSSVDMEPLRGREVPRTAPCGHSWESVEYEEVPTLYGITDRFRVIRCAECEEDE